MSTKPKLGAPGRQRLEQLRGEPLKPSHVSMFLRGAAAFSPEQIDQLRNAGATIRTRAGAVITIDAPLDDVERILDHEFVIASELSAPLYPDSHNQ